ncbi:MAG: hypothetical protein PWP08_1497 [Methanofollis sp.]|nr:hypothetical protein [Methanofollis sp.]
MDDIIYLNNAATTWPKPGPVMQAVEESLRLPYYEEGRSSVPGQTDYLSLTRDALARFFRAGPPEHFVFTQNATDSLNVAIQGFVKRQDRPIHVVTTDLEHNSVLRPLRTLEAGKKISLTIVPSTDGRVSVDAIRQAVREETGMVVMTHGSNVLGTVQDIGSIGAFLKDRGIFFCVDAAQTAGQIPIDLSTVPVDALAFTGHKALFGLPGIGGLYLADPEQVDPIRQGGTGVNSKYPLQTPEMPMKFEVGTPNHPGIVSLLAGIRFVESVGIGEAARSTMATTRVLIDAIRSQPGILLYTKDPDLPVVLFNIEGMHCNTVSRILGRGYGVITRPGLHCAPLIHQRIPGGEESVRASLSYLNTEEECRKAAEYILEVAGSVDKKIEFA